jgi:hypothetical protein
MLEIMPSGAVPVPRFIPGIMLSSTFPDLKEHRAAFIKAGWVRDTSAFICIVSRIRVEVEPEVLAKSF